MKKSLAIFLSLLLMILVLPDIEVNATGENHLYYQTIKCKEADNYVKETLGDFINYESNLVMLNVEDIELGQGIYIANYENENLLPSFMYPVFVNNILSYIYRIYDDGTGNYVGIFGKNYADIVLENAGDSVENAPLFVESNGNELLVTQHENKVVSPSHFGTEIDYKRIDIEKQKRKTSISIVDIREENEFDVKKNTKTYYWTFDISIKETQGSKPWCAAYVTATALRYKTGQDIRASHIMSYYGKGSNDSCSIDMIRGYSSIKGVKFDGTYSGVISNSNLHGNLRGMNPVYGGYSSNIGNHALLIHGISDNARLVWNPWYSHSEWTSSSNTYKANGTTFTMYRYGTFF